MHLGRELQWIGGRGSINHIQIHIFGSTGLLASGRPNVTSIEKRRRRRRMPSRRREEEILRQDSKRRGDATPNVLLKHSDATLAIYV
jgi:hypothetical protein